MYIGPSFDFTTEFLKKVYSIHVRRRNHRVVHVGIHIPSYTWNPNDHCFGKKGPCFGEFPRWKSNGFQGNFPLWPILETPRGDTKIRICLRCMMLTMIVGGNGDNQDDTVDGSEILHQLGCIKPCKYWDKLPKNWFAGFRNYQPYHHEIRRINHINHPPNATPTPQKKDCKALIGPFFQVKWWLR